MSVELHDGSRILLKKVMDDFDPLNRAAAASYIRDHQRKGEIVTGLLYIDENAREFHDMARTVEQPLSEIPYEELNPGSNTLRTIMDAYR